MVKGKNYRMGKLVYVKNWFYTSCYGLVVRLVPNWKGYIKKSHFSWRLLRSKVLVY